MEKGMGGNQFMIKELQQKEQNYFAEIKTLERHIDHLTHQLELAHKAMKEIQEERDKLEIEINNHRQMNMTQENNTEGLQRLCSQLEQDKNFMQQQINDLKIESSALRQQIEIDKDQSTNLELVIQNERQAIHENQFKMNDFARQNQELSADLDRANARIQSLQKHIDTLQRYSPAPGISTSQTIGNYGIPLPNVTSPGSTIQVGPQSSSYDNVATEELRRAQETIEKLRAENEQSQRYIQQYENQIGILESEVNELGRQND